MDDDADDEVGFFLRRESFICGLDEVVRGRLSASCGGGGWRSEEE